MGIIEHPLVMERAMGQINFDNKFQFIVRIDSAKSDIKSKIESRHDVTVEKVNTQVTMRGKKRATVRLSGGSNAQEIASRTEVS